jgi:hypothetical protein
MHGSIKERHLFGRFVVRNCVGQEWQVDLSFHYFHGTDDSIKASHFSCSPSWNVVRTLEQGLGPQPLLSDSCHGVKLSFSKDFSRTL